MHGKIQSKSRGTVTPPSTTCCAKGKVEDVFVKNLENCSRRRARRDLRLGRLWTQRCGGAPRQYGIWSRFQRRRPTARLRPRYGGAGQEMVDGQSGVAAGSVPEIIPEGIDTLVQVECSQRIGPTLGDEASIAVSDFRAKQGVVSCRMMPWLSPLPTRLSCGSSTRKRSGPPPK